MAEFPSFSLQQRTSLQQQQSQTQTQKLSQKQLMSVKLLAMSSLDLRSEIYSTVARNPALVITKDGALDGVKEAQIDVRNKNGGSDNLRLSSVTQAGKLAADNFQAALESSPDDRETLAEHLEHQFLSVNHSPSQEKLGLALIHNLDDRGFFILEPHSIIDKNDVAQTPELVDQTISYIQQLDPVGTCCKNVEESLLIQARANGDAPEAVLFILNGHFDFLNPPQPAKILKKIKEFCLKNLNESEQKIDFTEEEIASAVEYIRKLNPFPAAEFSPSQNAFIEPDVYVEKNEETGEYSVRANDEILPVVEISKDFYELSLERTRVTKSTEESEKKRSEHRFVMESIRSATDFMESLEFRKKTLLLACREIVRIQKDFFEKGARFLKPLRQKDIAALINVHEATISRMANEKYLRCSQGLFKLSYFFTNAVGGAVCADKSVEFKNSHTQTVNNSQNEKSEEILSKEGVIFELKQILAEHKDDKKPLSDQKIADILDSKGIKIARRTVAKYRSQLNIESSYAR